MKLAMDGDDHTAWPRAGGVDAVALMGAVGVALLMGAALIMLLPLG